MKKGLFVGLIMVLSSFSFADWQYTRWGMTPDEVIAASNEKMEKINLPDPKAPALLKAPYQSDDYKFEAFFSFEKNDNKLVSVALKPISSNDCVDLGKSLIAKYGKPHNSGRVNNVGYIMSWKYINKDNMTYLFAPNLCYLKYSSVNDTSIYTDKGL